MKDSENPRVPGGNPKKHGDFTKFIKKPKPPSKSNKTAKPTGKRFEEDGEKRGSGHVSKPFEKSDEKRSSRPSSRPSSRNSEQPSSRSFARSPERTDEQRPSRRPSSRAEARNPERPSSKSFSKSSEKTEQRPSSRPSSKPYQKSSDRPYEKKFKKFSSDRPRRKRTPSSGEYVSDGGLIRLNKFIANSGVCSRREADRLIETGAVQVNGEIVAELGAKMKPTDKVQIGGQTLTTEKPQYVLLNKPKGFITTTDDPLERKTVMALIEHACKERVYPVGRLDRNTTGLLLFTNDGDLAKKLTHPRHDTKKIYHVYLEKPLTKSDLIKISEGVHLEDGFIKPDKISYVGAGVDKHDIGLELHSGRNRVVRRIFESLDYKVEKLDRVFFAGLTKKDLPRGKCRLLTKEEISFLKML